MKIKNVPLHIYTQPREAVKKVKGLATKKKIFFVPNLK